MNPDRQTYVLDTGPLSHFARSQWLGVLKAVLANVTVVIPDVVEAELRDGATRHSYLQMVLDADWVGVVRLHQSAQITAFTYYKQRLVGPDGRNVGECGVLALTEPTPRAVAVVDDRVRGTRRSHARSRSAGPWDCCVTRSDRSCSLFRWSPRSLMISCNTRTGCPSAQGVSRSGPATKGFSDLRGRAGA